MNDPTARWPPVTASTHDNDIKWKHFLHYCPFVRGINRSPVNSPHKGQWHGVFVFSLICAWMDGWVNNREASDLRHHRAHYDVTVMRKWLFRCVGHPWDITCHILGENVYFLLCWSYWTYRDTFSVDPDILNHINNLSNWPRVLYG